MTTFIIFITGLFGTACGLSGLKGMCLSEPPPSTTAVVLLLMAIVFLMVAYTMRVTKDQPQLWIDSLSKLGDLLKLWKK